jgi:hypothetical protein
MNESNKLARFDKSTADLFWDTVKHLLEGLTGIAASGKADLILSLGRVCQATIGGECLLQLLKEWETLREKGKTKEDYEDTKQHRACRTELLRYLDSDIPDEEVFTVLKKIFMVSATEDFSEREDVLPQQYMKIASSVSSGEVLVLTAAYSYAVFAAHYGTEEPTHGEWLGTLADMSCLSHAELIQQHLESLSQRSLVLRPGTRPTKPRFGLTTLGHAFCDFINKYDEL